MAARCCPGGSAPTANGSPRPDPAAPFTTIGRYQSASAPGDQARLVKKNVRVPFSSRRLFIPRRAIHSGNREIVEAEIDAQDRPVVDQMVEDEAPQHGRAR